jgi:hypothetical protein
MGSIDTIIQEMQTLLAEAIPELSFGDGERELRGYGMPRITWVDGDDTFGPADKRSMNPRSLRTRNAGLDVYIAAENRGQAEAISIAVQAAANRVAAGSYEVTGGRTEGADFTDAGLLYVLAMTFAIPVPDQIRPIVTFTKYEPGPGTPGDGILETGES